MLSACAMSTVEQCLEFLEMRRTHTGLFATEPAVDEGAWLGFYNSPKSLERGMFADISVTEATSILESLDALRNPRGKAPEARLNAVGLIIGLFTDASSTLETELNSILFVEECYEAESAAEPETVASAPVPFIFGSTSPVGSSTASHPRR